MKPKYGTIILILIFVSSLYYTSNINGKEKRNSVGGMGTQNAYVPASSIFIDGAKSERKNRIFSIKETYSDIVMEGWKDPYFPLASHWAPTIYQDTDDTYYKGDYITNFNYDGDWIGNNNWENLDYYDPLWAYVYYAVIETDTHYFIFYMFYHGRDWNDIPDAGLGEHENDMEGAMVVITKDWSKYGSLLLMETRAHWDFYQYTNDPNIGTGSDDVDGGIIPDSEGRPTVFIEAKGHGVYAWDGSDFPGGDGVIYRYCSNVTDYPEYGDDSNVTYSLIPIMRSLWPRRHDIGNGHMYDQPFIYSGGRFSFVNEIPGSFDGDTNQPDAANPPWGMDDGDDGAVYKGDWFFDPAYTVNVHLSIPYDFSLDYVYNPYLIEEGPEWNSPNIIIYSPNPSEYLNSRTVNISWYVDDEFDLYKVTMSINGTTYYSGDQKGYQQLSVSLQDDGVYELNITAIDIWGNYKTIIRRFIVDTIPPTVNIMEPADNSSYSYSDISIEWTVSDDMEFSEVRIYVDGEFYQSSDQEQGSTTVTLDDGQHIIRVEAYDVAGNMGYDEVTIFVDTSLPQIDIISPENESLFGYGNITVKWNGGDEQGIDRYELYVDDAKIAELDNNTTEYTLDLEEGAHSIKVVAYDTVGNNNSDRIVVYIDLSPPSIQIYEPYNNTYVGENVTVKWNADDNYGLSFFEIYLNDTLLDTLDGDSRQYTIYGLDSGEYVIRVVAYDNVNHQADSSVIVYLDEDPPRITFLHDNYTVFVESIVTISWACWDENGIGDRYVKIDDNNYVEVYKDNITLELSDGEHIIRVRVFDTSGNIAEKALIFYVDTSTPTLIVKNPENNTYLNTSTVNISWVANDACGIKKTTIIVDQVETYETDKNFIIINVGEGDHEIIIITYDYADRNDSATICISVDMTSPTITILSPQNNSKYMDIIEISWNATDNSDVDHVKICLDGMILGIFGENETISTNLNPGSHEILLIAYDLAGNTGRARVIVYTVMVEIIEPGDGANVSLHSIIVEWETLYIDNVDIYLNGSLIASEYSANGSMEIELSSEGKWNITISDSTEKAFYDCVFITVDWTPPTVIMDEEEIIRNTTDIEINIDYRDEITGVRRVYLYLNGSLVYTGLSRNIQINAEEGKWILNITAEDYAGNANSTSATLIIDLTGPFADLYPQDGQSINDTSLLISWTTYDELSGIKGVTISIDDKTIYSGTSTEGSVWINITNGEHTIELCVSDRAGNTERRVSRIYVDAPPFLVVRGIQNNTYINTDTIWISWYLFNGEIVEQHAYLDSIEIPISTNNTTLSLDEGTHIITIYVIDVSGYEIEENIIITVDLTPPILNILSPENNSIINATIILLDLEAEDNMAIDTVIICLNGEIIETNDTSMETRLSEGENIIDISLYDRAGNMDTKRLIIYVDTTPPQLIILSPNNGTTVNTTEVNISWYMNDNYGIGDIEIAINNITMRVPKDTTWINVSLNSTTTIITIKIWDEAGNKQQKTIIIYLETCTTNTTASNTNKTQSRNIPLHIPMIYVVITLISIPLILKRKKRPRQEIVETEHFVELDEAFIEIESELEEL